MFLTFLIIYLATELITELCKYLDCPKSKVSENWRRDLPEDKTSGVLNPWWTYFFHGGQCKFEGRKTGQTVAVELRNYPDLVEMLDPYFFLEYVRATPAQVKTAALLDGEYEKARYVCQILCEEYRDELCFDKIFKNSFQWDQGNSLLSEVEMDKIRGELADMPHVKRVKTYSQASVD